MELMVVMGIMVLILGMGVLVYNTLTGNRSISMAQNQVAGMLARARAMAMNSANGLPEAYGVCFFLDQQTDRSAMMLFRRTDTAGGDPDPMNNYKGWSSTATYNVGDRVLAVVRDWTENNAPQSRVFRCKVVPAVGVRPPRFPGENAAYPLPFPMENAFWVEDTAGGTESVDDSVELLPAGVGLQTITDSTVTPTDRYLRTGAILFDKQGHLEHLTYVIPGASTLGQRIGLSPAGGIGGVSLYSQMGVVLYDTEMFRNQAGTSEGDASAYVQVPGLAPPASLFLENAEETWLDNNAAMLLVNRYGGELMRAR